MISNFYIPYCFQNCFQFLSPDSSQKIAKIHVEWLFFLFFFALEKSVLSKKKAIYEL